MTSMPAHRHARIWTFCACLWLGGCATLVDPSAEPSAADPASSTPVANETLAPAPAPPPPATPPEASTAPASAAPVRAAPVRAAPSAPPLPRSRLDPDQDSARLDLWQRVRDGLALPDLDDEFVRKWEQWYADRPEYVQRMTERGARYLFHIVEEVERRGLPTELALLPFIESAFNPQALSNARAAGMWQFMPATGKDFELHQNLFRDDRRDVLASTRAALDYLERLYARFGDWHLALAAYNWGQGNVQRAVDRNRAAGLPTDYASLKRLPLETREYVPKLQAVKNIVLRPEAYDLALPPLENHPYFLSVGIERDIDVALAARLAGLTLEEFQQLNPQHHNPVILAAGTPQVLLPYDNANRFIREVGAHPGPMASWTAWVAPRTLKPAEVARMTGMSEQRLREINHIPPRMLVKAGSTLLVPRSARSDVDVPERIADNAAISLAPEGPQLKRVAFKVGRKGDTVTAVARRYRVSAAQVARWNGVPTGTRFAPGQSVVVMVPVRPARGRARVATTSAPAAAKAAPTTRSASRSQGTPGRARVPSAKR
jgi:peptidoglycan lytic transglycosylase D